MILTCPECSTRFQLDPAQLGAKGRTVRCANCGHRWLAKPPEDTPAAIDFPPPEPVASRGEARRRPARPPEPRRAALGSASLVGWLVGVLVVLLMASAIIGRNEIVAGFPASASIYERLGLPITIQLGLQFEDVESEKLSDGGVPILIVKGMVVNVAEGERMVPPIKITLLDGDGRELEHQLFEVKDTGALPARARTEFSARIVNPAEQARNFSVTFEVGS